MYDGDVMDLMLFTNVAWLMQPRCNIFRFHPNYLDQIKLLLSLQWSSSKTNSREGQPYIKFISSVPFHTYIVTNQKRLETVIERKIIKSILTVQQIFKVLEIEFDIGY